MKGIKLLWGILLLLSVASISLATHSTDLGSTLDHRPLLEVYLRDDAALGKTVAREDSTLNNPAQETFAHSAVQSTQNPYLFHFQPTVDLPNGEYTLTAYFLENGVVNNDPEMLIFIVNDGTTCGNNACNPGESCETLSGTPKLCSGEPIPPGGSCMECNYLPPENCGNSVCDPGENNENCPQDCPKPPTCPNGICDPKETPENCVQDCKESPPKSCPNGQCDPEEDNLNCPQDCPAPPTCPNGKCDLNENNDNCIQDCPPQCGNNACETGENNENCPQDCPKPPTCPNGVCDASLGENTMSCPQDCPCSSMIKNCAANATEIDNALRADGCPLPNTCCGDGKCEGLETNTNCPDECKKACAELGGNVCNVNQACSGNLLDAQDTIDCCTTACVAKAGDTCSDCGQGIFNLCDRLECYSMLETCLFTNSLPAECSPCTQFGDCSAYKDEQSCTDNHCNFPGCEWTGTACIRSGSCSDGLKNGQESDVDCGGVCPAKCSKDKECKAGADCASGLCMNSVCKNPTCSPNDGCVVNCVPHDSDCPPVPNCLEDGNCVLGCPSQDPDCLPESCSNGIKDGQESDVDCGGNCAKCDLDKKCLKNNDCSSNVCENSICKDNALTSCNDNLKNQDETDVDCGGVLCDKCPVLEDCRIDNDCVTNLCFNGKCSPIPTCKGGDACKVNCLPPDPDCPPKPSCLSDDRCILSCPSLDPDCPTTSCTNGFKDGDETGVDCGGACSPCQTPVLTLNEVSKKHDFSQLSRLSAGFLPIIVQTETNNVAFCSLSEEQSVGVDLTKLFTGESSTVLRTFHEGSIEVKIAKLFSLSPEQVGGKEVYRKTFFVVCRDDFDQVSQISIEVLIPAFEAFLQVPRLGVAGSTPFKVVVETAWPMFCTYAQIPLSGVSAGALFNDGPVNGLKLNHTINNRSMTGDLFIACKTSASSEAELFKTFNIYVDTTPPVIQAAFDPVKISDRASKFSNLQIQTDDLTLCTQDNGTVTNILPFDEMDPSTYVSDRTVQFDFRSIFDSEVHNVSVNVTCKNLAGLSSSKTAGMTVELDDSLDIIPISPAEVTNAEPVELQVETTKLATCSFEGAARKGSMATSDQKRHFVSFDGLSEGSYSFKVTCRATASPDRALTLPTQVDRTAPTIDDVVVQSPSCNLDKMEFEIRTNDSDASSFSIKIVDQDQLIINETRPDKTITIKAPLSEGKRYTVQVTPIDKAGNAGIEIDRDVDVLSPNDAACDKIKPKGSLDVQPLPARSIKKALVRCDDKQSGCTLDFLRGSIEPDGNCIPDQIEFYGTDIEVSTTEKFCYTVFDKNNNSFTEARVIDVVIPESCTNGVQDVNELGVDCGLNCPQGCPEGSHCTLNSDCLSDYCESGICKAPSCTDGVKNGNEMDVDCGGSEDCPKCEEGKKCIQGGDCASGYCTPDRFCRTPSCSDGFQNGLETDKDCGGNCPSCTAGKSCAENKDCQSKFCESGICIQDKDKDTDKDGMPDWWETKYDFNIHDPSNADQDADGDGFTNLEEYKAGTNPKDPKSHPASRVPLGSLLLLLSGLFLAVGGAAYLVYKKSLPPPKAPPKAPMRSTPGAPPKPAPRAVNLSLLRRDLGKRLERSRLLSAFGGFSPAKPAPKPISNPPISIKPSSPKAPEKPTPKSSPVPAPKPIQATKSAPKAVEKSSPKPKKKKDTSLDKDFKELEKLSKF